jgi:peptidylprolyl isomerase
MPKRKVRKYRSRKSRKPILIVGSIVAVVVIIIVAYSMLGASSPGSSSKTKVMLITSMGNIVIKLRDDRPTTTANFENLVRQGTYDNTTFHRVIADFMIQGGDPTGTGYGDPSIPPILDEIIGDNHNYRGSVAMANTGQPNTGSSQFFINVVNNTSLDTKYTVFGTVIEGMDVVDAISKVPVVADPNTGENSRPAQDVTIITAQILD